MGNKKFIESALQKIDTARTTLMAWATKPEVTFEEQKAVASTLSEALSDVWLVITTSETAKETAKSIEEIKQLTQYRETLLSTLSGLRSELDKVLPTGEKPHPVRAAEGTPPAKQEPLHKPQPGETSHHPGEAKPQPKTAASKEPTTAIVDIFTVHEAHEPALLTPIDKLSSSIGLSDRFMFIKELFNNNADLFTTTVKHIDTLNNLEEAHAHMDKVAPHVSRSTPISKQFDSLLVRRFMHRQFDEAKK